MPDLPHIYVESCCFIDAAKGAIGTANKARDTDVWYLWKLLEAHKDRAVEVFTSVLTIAECTHADGNDDARVRGTFERLLASGQFCALIQPTVFIAIDARDLRWKHGIRLQGADGLHVASGLAKGCQEFLTTDDRISANAAKIAALGMRVCAPSKTNLLPPKYRQGDMLNEKVTPIRRAANGPPPNQPA
jgi:hypothetical protein